MFAEELTKVKESETYADELQKKANVDSKQSIADAKTKAEKMLSDARIKAKDIYDTLIKEGQEISDQQYNAFLEDKKKDCADVISRARKNEESAIALIAERIVRDSVNC
ncbi:MAG: hypothetical protein Q4E84_06435 [Clostridia bacterium]|nr:hypothetical protein [Clostridia bacterium]